MIASAYDLMYERDCIPAREGVFVQIVTRGCGISTIQRTQICNHYHLTPSTGRNLRISLCCKHLQLEFEQLRVTAVEYEDHYGSYSHSDWLAVM
jgi:hypothetical protein